MGQFRVSVVINTLDRADSLEQTLLALRQLRYPWFEVVVVHGPCRDHTKEVLARFTPAVRVGVCPEANLAISRNIGIAMARGEIVAFLDDDAIPEPDWLDQLLTSFQDPEVGAVGGFIRNRDGVLFQHRYVVADPFGTAENLPELPASLERNKYLSPTGTNVACRRSALHAIGGFDEEYAYFLDETDVNFRLSRAGWKLDIRPAAEVHHKFSGSRLRNGDQIPQSLYLIARSKSYFCWTNGSQSYSDGEIEQHLLLFRENRRRGIRKLRRNRKISAEHFRKLVAEIDTGVRDGAHDARLPSRKRLPADQSPEAGVSLPFEPYVPPPAGGAHLRICMLARRFPPPAQPDGIREIAAGLVARGHEVTIICEASGGVPLVEFIDGVWVHRIVTRRFPGSRADLPPGLRFLQRFAAAAAAEIERVRPRRQFQLVTGDFLEVAAVRALGRLDLPAVVATDTRRSATRSPHRRTRPAVAQSGEIASPSVDGLERRMIRRAVAHER